MVAPASVVFKKKIMIVGQALNLLDRGWFVFETYPHTHRGEERERERERERESKSESESE